MNNKTKSIVAWVAILVVIFGGFGWYAYSANKLDGDPAEYQALASCLADSGAKFYGAYWCPHCKNQKAMFGDAAESLPYVECTEEEEVCMQQKIEVYPTWIFADGTRATGEQSLAKLAEKTGCVAPSVN
jgi:thiol-disulfide isomerase/thioredoxin